MTQLTDRFDNALAYASCIHRTQYRKGTTIPYVSHLLAVSSLTLQYGGDEDQAIAALLHDAAEDHQTRKLLKSAPAYCPPTGANPLLGSTVGKSSAVLLEVISLT